MRTLACVALVGLTLSGCNQPAAPSAPVATSIETPRVPPAPWRPTAFRLEGKTLPRDFQGNDGRAFGQLFEEISKKAAKGEYETSAAHRQRLQNLKGVLAPIDPAQEYAFVVPGVLFQYDADHQAYAPLTGFCGYADTWATTDHPDPACTIAKSISQTHSTVGRYPNIGDYYALVIPLKTARHFLKNGSWSATCPTPLDHARGLEGLTIEYALVGRVSGAEGIRVPNDTNTPGTFLWGHGIPFAPSRLICFVRETGEVLSSTSFGAR